MTVPVQPKIYHIMHVDRLPSIIADGSLWCDREVGRRLLPGSTIGMEAIKQRRLNEITLTSHPTLYVGDCVPFYFCPRSTMLYVIYQGNLPDLTYRDGQGSIIHLEADLHESVAWAEQNQKRWAFTLSNAGSRFFEDRCDLNQLDEVKWDAVQTNRWSGNGISPSVKEGKQAEFLIEGQCPWELVERIGVLSSNVREKASAAIRAATHKPLVEIMPNWYY
ncbi:MAG: DUF4433 domain-containing protein [Thermodesulfobacteriota bacterium]